MGTKNLYENGPNPFLLFGTKNLVRPTLMGTKNLYENGPNRQVWLRSDFSVNYQVVYSLSLSMRARYNNEIAEWK